MRLDSKFTLLGRKEPTMTYSPHTVFRIGQLQQTDRLMEASRWRQAGAARRSCSGMRVVSWVAILPWRRRLMSLASPA